MVLEITECSLFLTVLSFVFLLAASMSFYMASHDDCQTSTSGKTIACHVARVSGGAIYVAKLTHYFDQSGGLIDWLNYP